MRIVVGFGLNTIKYDYFVFLFFRSCVPIYIYIYMFISRIMTQLEFDNHDNNEGCCLRLKKNSPVERCVWMKRKMYRALLLLLRSFYWSRFFLLYSSSDAHI